MSSLSPVTGLDMLFEGAGVGIGLASMTFFANIYYRPLDVPPGIHPGDPQWIAAWYIPMLTAGLGVFIIGIIYMVDCSRSEKSLSVN